MPSKRRSSSAAKQEESVDKKQKVVEVADGDGAEEAAPESVEIGASSPGKRKQTVSKKKTVVEVADEDGREETASGSAEIGDDSDSRFIGQPIPVEEARERWPHRFRTKNKGQGVQNSKGFEDSDDLMKAKRHFSQALVDGVKYNLKDDAHVQGEDGKPHYICKIVEMFEGVDSNFYFRAQWFYRAQDTVIENSFDVRETKRVFFSEVQDDNPLDCLVENLRIVKLRATIDVVSKLKSIPDCDYYYDMLYLVPYASFLHASTDSEDAAVSSESTISSDLGAEAASSCAAGSEGNGIAQQTSEMRLLDLYSGCGAMSTGLCLGANIYGVNLVTKWAIDFNEFACESLKLNHPETEVRNETVEDFLTLLKEWEKLCVHFSLKPGNEKHEALQDLTMEEDDASEDDEDDEDDGKEDPEVFEVERILAICYGDPKEMSKPGLYMKVRWRNYGPEEDTWEPIEGLRGSPERIKEFVISGFNAKLLPLPGDVDAICGGPPCQGISGFNRFRNKESPLEDPKNRQLKVYMDVVEYLKPKYVLMENVVDMVKFAGGFLGRYALGRLVDMNYQARLGIMAAGAYGLPQCRMRVFLWGARPTEKLPQYPLPTHDLVYRGVVPVEFEKIVVAYEEGQAAKLRPKLFLEDAISDLPEVTNYEERERMPYGTQPKTEFQHFIRLSKDALLGLEVDPSRIFTPLLLDHQPLLLNEDDYQRVCRIPKKKGANFRDLPGVRVRPDNKVEWDPDVPREYLPSKKPVVPDYAMSFVKGSSSKPFGRLWWDETVPTVVTRAEPHNQAITHPVQDRVLTIRENARLQGFPDYYKLYGPIKQRYMQVGNAVAVPVARALGFGMAKASQGDVDGRPVFALPPNFPKANASPASSQDQTVN